VHQIAQLVEPSLPGFSAVSNNSSSSSSKRSRQYYYVTLHRA
jgi:hypothetical protein